MQLLSKITHTGPRQFKEALLLFFLSFLLLNFFLGRGIFEVFITLFIIRERYSN
jgi:hypothetical protein